MFMMPSAPLFPIVDVVEGARLASGRPASRAEIHARHLRERHAHGALVAPAQTIGATRPIAAIRHLLGRALADHRLAREAA